MSESAPAAPAASGSALTPSASDLLAPPPALTVEQAQAKKAEYLGKAGFAERVLAGDAEASKQWREVTRALSPQVDQTTQEGKDYTERMAGLSILKAKADLPIEVWDWVAAGGPVSPAEKEKAIFAKERNFKDRAWIQRYLDGGRAENSEMTNINLILSARVGTFDEIEAFKAKAAKRLNGGTK